MIAKRVIPCLDMKEGCVVKGINFESLAYAGDPVELAKKYYEDGADEIVFLDISASREKRSAMVDVVARTAKVIFIPFTVGGGIKSVGDIRSLLSAGADKVALNTNAFLDPAMISRTSREFGSQCIVLAVDAKWNGKFYEVFIYGGKEGTSCDVLEWIRKGTALGAGEILITSVDRDGTKKGFDTLLISEVCNSVNVPVIASGGASKPDDFLAAFKAGADAALAASIFHYGNYSVQDIKKYLNDIGVVVR